MSAIELSIAIPTYNRADSLKPTLVALSQQSVMPSEIVILNNASTDATADIVLDFKSRNPQVPIRLISNIANLGGNANITRCFEEVKGEWLWLLGDDDFPLPDAVERIQTSVSLNPHAIFLNFASSILSTTSTTRRKDFNTFGLNTTIRSIDCFSNFLFISAGVYRTKAFLPYLREAYGSLATYAPHVAMLFGFLKDHPEAQVHFSSESIVEWSPPDPTQAWDRNKAFTGFAKLCQHIPDDDLRAVLFSKISANSFRKEKLSFSRLRNLAYSDRYARWEIVAFYSTTALASPKELFSFLRWTAVASFLDLGGQKMFRALRQLLRGNSEKPTSTVPEDGAPDRQ